MDETRRIDIYEYTTNGCSIKSIAVPIYIKDSNTEKERIMLPKEFYAPRFDKKITVTVSRTITDLDIVDYEVIQQLVLTYSVHNGQSVDIERIRKDIVTGYGYSEEVAKTFNVSKITYRDLRNEKVQYNDYHRQSD